MKYKRWNTNTFILCVPAKHQSYNICFWSLSLSLTPPPPPPTHTHQYSVVTKDFAMHGARLPLLFTCCEMTSRQFGAGQYSVPFNRNKCSSFIDTAWLEKEVILEYRLASLSYNTSTPNNQLQGEHYFRWHLGWKTWTLKWSYDLLDTFTFPWSIIPF